MQFTCLPYTFLAPSRPVPYVARPALLERLAAGRAADKCLSLLWGSPGGGKSALAAEYARESGLPSLWVHLTPFGLDPALFLSRLLVGLKATFPSFDPSWAPLLESTSYKAASPAVTGNLYEALSELAPEGFVLVLDLGELAPSPTLRLVLELLNDVMPPAAQLIVVSDAPDAPAHVPVGPEARCDLGPEAWALGADELAQWGLAAPAPADWLEAAFRHWCAEQGCAPQGPYPAPWQMVLPVAARLPWVESELWQAVVEPLAPWPAAAVWPPVLTRLGAEAPVFRAHSEAIRRWGFADAGLDAQALLRRLGVHLNREWPLDAIPVFLQADDPFQAEALAGPVGEALMGAYHYGAIAELLALFPERHLAVSPRLCCLKADWQRVTGGLDAALASYQEAETQARARGDARWQGRALAGQAAVWGMRGNERFYTLALSAKEALPAEDRSGLAQVYNLLGIYHVNTNELPIAITYLDEGLRLYGAIGDRMGQGKVLINLGLCHSKLGRFGKARQFYQEAIGCAEASLKLPIPMVYNNLARVHLLQGDLKRAWEAAERAFNLAQQLGARRDVAHVEWTLGEINAQRGDWAKATRYFEASRDSAAEQGDALAQASALASLAELAMRQEAWAKARLLLDGAIALRGLPLSDPAAFNLAEVAARLHLELGEIQQAAELLTPIQRYMERYGFRYFQASVEFALARVRQAEGDVIAAEASYQSASKLAGEYDFHHLKRTESRGYLERIRVVPAAAEAIAPQLQVASFAHFEARVEGLARDEQFGRSKKTQQLLVYLLLHRKGLTREELGELFGHQGDSRSSASLMLVSRLRQALEPALAKHQPSRFVLLQDGRYTFNFGLNYTFDAEEFLYLSAQARDPLVKPEEQLAALKQALDLYRGPFLPNCDDEWCVIERERFRLLANEGYELLFKAFLERQDFRETLRLADLAIKQDFLNEEAHRTKLIALARQGKREEALKHFKRTDQHFLKKFGLRPSEALVGTFQQIMRGQLR